MHVTESRITNLCLDFKGLGGFYPGKCIDCTLTNAVSIYMYRNRNSYINKALFGSQSGT